MNFIRRYILKQKPPEPVFFGLKKDKEDRRDIPYKAKYRAEQLPEDTGLRNLKKYPFMWDQGNIGKCVGESVSGALVMALITNNQKIFEPSRLFAYYNARTDENKNIDSGASIRDGIKGLAKYGICDTKTWPEDIAKFNIKPSEEAYLEAQDHQLIIYEKIYPVTKEKIMDAVYRGFPVVYGKRLFESFLSAETASTGIVKVPRICWEEEIGAHAMWIIDYEKRNDIETNSWGIKWGMNGFCKVPWKYVLDSRLAFDFWVIYKSE
jgi:C1A family cysteine protease